MKDIELKHSKLINMAKYYMSQINDYEHDINHMNDVVEYTYELIDKVNVNIDKEVCVISAYWHDVGRTKCTIGHEKLSADMLKEEMEKQGYNKDFIDKCYIAIEKHKWNMTPENNEGLLIKDADKLAFIGKNRWEVCLKHNQQLDSIVDLLPRLRNEILYFDESRKIYDRDIVKLVDILYMRKK